MQSSCSITPTSYVDQHGRVIIRVPLSNAPLMVELLSEDFDRACAAGLGPFWHLNSNGGGKLYVRKTVRDWGQESIARFIARAGRGEAVYYRDGNPLNLRPENLMIRSRAGACRDLPANLRSLGQIAEWASA